MIQSYEDVKMRYFQDKGIDKLVRGLVRDDDWKYARGRRGRLSQPRRFVFITISSILSDRR